ncbi:hypothetical protein [Riemerella columbina]|uniref:hypothetical protein n=1 Tax=Riemerella columbina TaxID=103810 RepID=UPI0012EA69B5|nr:hypothetical protein [Riemerella columbina]
MALQKNAKQHFSLKNQPSPEIASAKETILLPAHTLQSFVENAILHGIKKKYSALR